MEKQPSQTPTYESRFNTEAIVDLVTHIQQSLSEYQKKQGNDMKLDTFVLLAALSNVAFSVAYNTLATNDEQRDIARLESERIVDGLLAKIDGIRAEFGTQWYSDLIAITNLMGSVTETYSNRRDSMIRAIMLEEENKIKVSDAPTEGATPPEDVQ